LTYFAIGADATSGALERMESMARVLISSLRIKIMAALSVGPMSPRMFQRVYGGGDLARIDTNFKELLRFGWIELVEVRTGGKRRGAVEHVYRAAQLPIFDSVVWPALPAPMREMVSWRICRTLTKRFEEALAAGTMDARDDRHFTWTPGLVDQTGWDRIVGRADALFDFLLEELRSAGPRLAASGEQPIPLTVALAVFESPARRFRAGGEGPGRIGADTRAARSVHAFTLRMAKVMIDALRIMILAELGTRAMSAKLFSEEFGGGEITKNRVYRAFQVLKRFDWIVPVETKTGGRRRGGRECFYRASRPPILDSSMWPSLSESMKDVVSGKIFDTLSERLREAMEAGTMDARTDRHFTWTPGTLDQKGWDRVIGRLDALFDFTREEVEAARARLAESGRQPIPMTVAIAGFESPAPSTRAH
jgi:hypothetical protein